MFFNHWSAMSWALVLLTANSPVIARATGADTDPSTTITIHRNVPAGVSQFHTGVTHTQYSLDPFGDAEAVARGKALLTGTAVYHNRHIMGWGADNPNPAPSQYNWRSLDERLAIIGEMRGIAVITLCACPDWMKGGQPGRTDWSKIEVAPLPEHYADFAELAKQVARRYPDVLYYQVWNEMKGLWNGQANNWDYQGYTRLYNLVYDALKSVNPQIKVGGPYLVIEGTGSNKGGWATETPIRQRQWEVLNYWLKNKHGADFITLDRSVKDSHDKNAATNEELMERTPYFQSIALQIRTKTDLPLWWAEYYGATPSNEYVAAHYASIMLHMIKGGTTVALLWGPQATMGHGLFSDTRRPGGGRPLPHYTVFKLFHDHFSAGAKLCQAESSSPDVEVLATDQVTLLINKSPRVRRVVQDGAAIELGAYEVRLVPG